MTKKEKDKLTEKHDQALEAKEERILALEKKDTLRDEREMKGLFLHKKCGLFGLSKNRVPLNIIHEMK